MRTEFYWSFVAIACAMLFVPTAAHAYRPFDGTDGDVAELGEFELELGPVQLLHADKRNYLLTPATVLNLGIIPRVELVVDFVGNVPLRRDPGEAGYQVRDTDVLLKFLLRKGVLQEDSGPSIALETGPLTPEIAGEKGFGAIADLIVSEQAGWFIAHLNSIAELGRGDLAFTWTSTLIGEFRFNEIAWPVMELRWDREVRSGDSVYSALAGFIWSVTEGLDVDGAAMVASVDGQPSFQGRLGLTWATPFWGEQKEEGNDEEKNAHASSGRGIHGTRSGRAMAIAGARATGL
jgi:hypothetical protein